MLILEAVEACNDPGVLSVILFFKNLVQLAFYVVPIILIVMILIDLAKAVVANKEDNMTANRNRAIKRIVYCIFVFFVPTIVGLVMNLIYDLVDDASQSGYLLCIQNANKSKIEQLKEIETVGEENGLSEEDIEKWKNEYNQSKLPTFIGPSKDDEEGSSGDSSSGGGSTNGGNSESSATVTKYTVYVGDSRTNGMCAHVSGSLEKCIAKDGAGLVWFRKDGMSALKKELNNHKDANVVVNLGVNDLVGVISVGNNNLQTTTKANEYKKEFNSLLSSYPNINLIIASVGPVDDSKQKKVSSKVVDSFNDSMRSVASNLKADFCNINSSVSYVYANDGIHYDSNTYKSMYNAVTKCL